MSEKSSKILVTPHNQAFAKGDVLKINGLYWRVLGAQDAKPYAKLLLIGSKHREEPYVYGADSYRFPQAFESDFYYTEPTTGKRMVTPCVPYYSKDMAPKDTNQYSADSSCVKWASEQEFSNYLGTVGCPVHTAYRVVDTNIVSGQNPALVVKSYNSSHTICSTYYIVPIGLTHQPGILRNCRLLSVTDIIEYFGRNEITDEEIFKDLLGGKHYHEGSTWSVNVEGSLYDTTKYAKKPGPNDGLVGLNLAYIPNDMTRFNEYGGVSAMCGALIVINLNLREYRN